MYLQSHIFAFGQQLRLSVTEVGLKTAKQGMEAGRTGIMRWYDQNFIL
jgi:hypothetical protein